MNRLFVRRNISTVSIIVFIIFFCFLQAFSPSFLYNPDGSFKPFGLGYKHKTVIPIWLITLILAIFSYLFVLYYLAMPKIKYY